MQREDDRDRAIDRALRQSIPSEALASARAASRDHIDGETLAAWSEGQLRTDTAARVEQHLSDCARCQQMLAAFARTAPPLPVVEPMWRRWHLQWLVPIATAATVAAIWVAIPRDEQRRATSPVVDRVAEAPQASAPAAPVTPQQSQNAAAAPPPSPSPPAAKEFKKSLSETVGQSAQSALKREEFERRDAQEQSAERQAAVPAQPQGAAVPTRPDTREKDNDKLQELQETIRVVPPAPAAAAAASPPASATAAGSTRARPQAADSRLLAARAFTAPSEIRSPNSQNRWRIVDGGRRVERSTNGGTEWETVSLSAPGVLTAGMSPAPSICWLVGRAGAVFVTADGLRFTRVMFPESIDLLTVAATDDRHATVMSLDGRSFRTDDGGMTWTR